MFFLLFKITIINSFILFKKIAPLNKTLSLKNIVLNLAQQLCEVDNYSRKKFCYSIYCLKGRHFITRLPFIVKKIHVENVVCMEKKVIDRGEKKNIILLCNV
uniref:Uncharacterized protein n=1 Tax=Schizaphis graminum TaxID=13262 RepID=A0A2S2P701_SCHGA